ncbi:hypothetical protein DS906_20475 [Ruegeria sp. A3M17]|nr:hypothetical protein DS906_20475 [Ruegeria sp. A3M17]
MLRNGLLLIAATKKWTMRKTKASTGDEIVKEIKRVMCKQNSSEEEIRIVLDGFRDEDSVAELCRRKGQSQGF